MDAVLDVKDIPRQRPALVSRSKSAHRLEKADDPLAQTPEEEGIEARLGRPGAEGLAQGTRKGAEPFVGRLGRAEEGVGRLFRRLSGQAAQVSMDDAAAQDEGRLPGGGAQVVEDEEVFGHGRAAEEDDGLIDDADGRGRRADGHPPGVAFDAGLSGLVEEPLKTSHEVVDPVGGLEGMALVEKATPLLLETGQDRLGKARRQEPPSPPPFQGKGPQIGPELPAGLFFPAMGHLPEIAPFGKGAEGLKADPGSPTQAEEGQKKGDEGDDEDGAEKKGKSDGGIAVTSGESGQVSQKTDGLGGHEEAQQGLDDDENPHGQVSQRTGQDPAFILFEVGQDLFGLPGRLLVAGLTVRLRLFGRERAGVERLEFGDAQPRVALATDEGLALPHRSGQGIAEMIVSLVLGHGFSSFRGP